jgi:hypothetical protein
VPRLTSSTHTRHRPFLAEPPVLIAVKRLRSKPQPSSSRLCLEKRHNFWVPVISKRIGCIVQWQPVRHDFAWFDAAIYDQVAQMVVIAFVVVAAHADDDAFLE